MKFNAIPETPVNTVEKPPELTDHVEILEGVLGKLKARTEAANDAYPHSRAPIDNIDWKSPVDFLYPNHTFEKKPSTIESPPTVMKKKLLKGLTKEQADAITSFGLNTGESEAIYVLHSLPKKEKKLVARGIIYGHEILSGNYEAYHYVNSFAEYGRALFTLLGQASEFENNLDARIRKLFSSPSDYSNIKESIVRMYRRQILEAIQKSYGTLSTLDDEQMDVLDEHDVYEDNITTAYISAENFKERGVPVPDYIESAAKRIDPDSKYLTTKMQEKHIVILKKIGAEIETIAQEMSQINLSAFLFLSTFKSLSDSGEKISLRDFKDSEVEMHNGGSVAKKDSNVMRTMYSSNQSEAGAHDVLLSKFDEKILDKKTNFYIFKWRDKIQSFIAFTAMPSGTTQASAFNVAPDARGYKIGEAMLHEAMDTEAREHKLIADCDSKLPISAKYIETGWIATRYWDDHGDKILDIMRNDKARGLYAGKQLSQEDIISGNVPDGAVVKTAGEQKDLPFELCNERYVLTRMFLDQKTRQYYAVFEPAPPARTVSETSDGASHK